MSQFSPLAARGASSSETSHLAHTLESAPWAPRSDATVGERPKSSLGILDLGLVQRTAVRTRPPLSATGWARAREGPHSVCRLQKHRPLHFGYHTRHEIRVELHRADADLGGLRGGGVWLGRDRSLVPLSFQGEGRETVLRPVPGGAGGSHGAPPLARASSVDYG